MKKLAEPDADLVERVLDEVGFEDRLAGYRTPQHVGAIITPLHSLEGVIHLLNDTFPQLNFKRLDPWIRNVILDEQLAQRVAEATEQESNDHSRTLRIRELLQERLCQCKKGQIPRSSQADGK